MEPHELKNLVDRRGAPGVYLVYGSDAPARERAVRYFQTEFCEPGLSEWCVVAVDGSESTGMEVTELASTPPFVGAYRVVVVRGAEELSDEEALIPLAADPPPFSIVVLAYGSVDKRRKLFQAVKAQGRLIECEAPTGDRLAERVGRMGRAAGVSLDEEAVAVLIERTGGDAGRIEREIEKLSAYAGEGAAIGKADAERVVASGAPTAGQFAIFDFVDAVAQGEAAKALRRLGELIEAGEPPLVILTMIGRQLRLIAGAMGYRGERVEAVARALDLKSTFPAKKALAQAGMWTVDRVAWALAACVECDEAMKRGTDGRLALETLTLKLAESAKKSRGSNGPQLYK